MQLKTFAALAALTLAGAAAQAATFHFDGDIAYHNDVIFTPFTMAADGTNVRVWTDSFHDGDNFDPITALWNADTGALIAENDDDASVDPAQTYYDSGFLLPSLAAGRYVFTVATYDNFAVGNTLAEGFAYDNDAPIALAVWDQPANGVGMGTYYSVRLDGVTSAVDPDPTPNPVPEPGSLALLLAGAAAATAVRRARRA